ncbi:MAG TPA: hypothetical protein VN112_16460 [Ensifer sp.]|nr:hypothetical protein [Ensifer sp.]
MVDSRPAILIAEDQIFIALEAERILSETFDCSVEICRRDRLADALAEKRFDLIVLEFSGVEEEDSHYVALTRAAGAQLLLLTASNDLADVSRSFPDVPLIQKPFNETEVRAFIERLLMGVQPG